MIDFFTAHRNIIAQAIGFMAMASAIISFQQKERKRILIWQLICSALWSLHFFALANLTGAVINTIQTVRCVMFFFKENHKWAQSRALPGVFLCLSVAAGILTWESVWDILPIIGMMISTIALWMTNPKHIRRLTIPVSVVWGIYDISAHSIAGICNEIFVIISILIAMYRYDRAAKEVQTVEKN